MIKKNEEMKDRKLKHSIAFLDEGLDREFRNL